MSYAKMLPSRVQHCALSGQRLEKGCVRRCRVMGAWWGKDGVDTWGGGEGQRGGDGL